MIKKKLIFIGLFAALLFTACKKEMSYEEYHTYCNVIINHSGHDLRITLVREDTTIQYHFADNDSAVFDAGEDPLMADNPPGYNPSPITWEWSWFPDTVVERMVTLTFDDTYSHVSREKFYYDSLGKLDRKIHTPEDCNFFNMSEPFFIFHHYVQNDTIFNQCILTPAYYDQAVEQSCVPQK